MGTKSWRRVIGVLSAVMTVSLAAVSVPLAGADASLGASTLSEYTRLPNGSWIGVNLTDGYGGAPLLSDGVPVVDPLTGFQNAYAITGADHLVEYTRLPDGRWVILDITAVFHLPDLTATPQPFTDPVSQNQIVFGKGTGGDVIQYARLPSGSWTAFDLTRSSGGPTVAASPQPIVDPLTHLLAVYSSAISGHLTEYARFPDGSWKALDVTAAFGGPSLFGSAAPFVDPLTGFQNVYATGVNFHLIEYTRIADNTWINADLTALWGGFTIGLDPKPFVDPVTHFQNAYVTTQSGHLAEYTRLPNGIWVIFDVSTATGAPPLRTETPFTDAGAQVVYAATNVGGQLVEFRRFPDGAWGKTILTNTGNRLAGFPRPIVDPLTGYLNVYLSSGAAATIIID